MINQFHIDQMAVIIYKSAKRSLEEQPLDPIEPICVGGRRGALAALAVSAVSRRA